MYVYFKHQSIIRLKRIQKMAECALMWKLIAYKKNVHTSRPITNPFSKNHILKTVSWWHLVLTVAKCDKTKTHRQSMYNVWTCTVYEISDGCKNTTYCNMEDTQYWNTCMRKTQQKVEFSEEIDLQITFFSKLINQKNPCLTCWSCLKIVSATSFV